MKKVLILYKFLPQYRVDFFNKLKDELKKKDVDLHLIYGKLKNTDALKNDEVEIGWAKFVPNKSWRFGKTELIWQPCLRDLRGKDLVIVEQANKLLLNYYLMFFRKFTSFKFANWGHGRNMQDNPKSLRNRFKFLFLRKCDWWFAYTKGVKKMLTDFNYPENKITVVQNAIDTVVLRDQYNDITDNEINGLKKELNIDSENVGIYCGGMYYEKRLDYMIESIIRIREKVKDFHMLFIGSGVDSYKAKEAAEKFPWIHYVGPKFGKDRVKYFKLAKVQLMPGLVGLGILDSFALETPIITTEYPFHSPEIEYLESGKNGIITADNQSEFEDAVIDAFLSKQYNTLISGCLDSAKIYTVEKMAENFKNGILECLN